MDNVQHSHTVEYDVMNLPLNNVWSLIIKESIEYSNTTILTSIGRAKDYKTTNCDYYLTTDWNFLLTWQCDVCDLVSTWPWQQKSK